MFRFKKYYLIQLIYSSFIRNFSFVELSLETI
jgi:hypothetical protein